MINSNKNYAWPVTSINKNDLRAFEGWYSQNAALISRKGVIIFGGGIRGTEFSLFMKWHSYSQIAFTDNNEDKVGGFIDEFPIISPQEAINRCRKNEAIILISVESSAAIEEQLEQQGLQRDVDFFTADNRMYEQYVSEFQRPYSGDYLVMGDCQFTTISVHDQDKRNLAEMLTDEMGADRLKILAMHGMGLRSHYHIMKVLLQREKAPGVCAVMINFDTLNGYQHLLPRSQHEELLRAIYQLGPAAEFEEYLHEVHKRSGNLRAEFSVSGGSKNTLLKARNYFQFNYLYDLDIHTEGLIYLRRIFETLQNGSTKIVPFLPPVNFEYAAEIFGDQFKERYERNTAKITDLLREYDLELLDLSFALHANQFAEKFTPDETTNELGRRSVTKLLMQRMEAENGTGNI